MKTETKVQHTPGPWTATDPHTWLANTPRFKCSIRYGTQRLGNSIAEVYLGGPGALKCDAESVNANARLIAAAPDLLEALRLLVRDNIHRAKLIGTEINWAAIHQAEAAIAKAEKREQEC